MDQYDVIIIGGGPGGYIAAIRAGQLGMKVLCVEKGKTYGGTCVNVGCIPSKALLESTHHYANLKKLSKHGIEVEGIKLNIAQLLKRKEAVVRQNTNGINFLFKKAKVESIQGNGRLKSANIVEVETAEGKKEFGAKHVILATGSEPTQLPFLPFDGKRVISSTEALELSEVPKHLLVVGGGVIGLELGSVWGRLGAKVTVVEFMDRILPTMDKDIGVEMKKVLTKQGFDFKLSTKVTAADVTADGVKLHVEDTKGNKETLEGDVVLVAIGRRPFSEGLGLEELGIKQDKAGRVEVDHEYKTNVPGVYAIGDLIAGPMLAHKASEEGVVCVERIAGQKSRIMYEAIPGIVYTWPEVGSVGFSEDEAKAKGIKYKVGKIPFSANPRARCADEIDGFVKILADEKTDKVIGVHMVGPNASEIITEGVTVMEFGGSAEDIGRITHGHPTLTEAIKEAGMLASEKRGFNF